MRTSFASLAVAATLSLLGHVEAKYVFAHYMMGSTDEDHIHQDIDDAITMGLDGFALNIGDPTADFIPNGMSAMFGYAAYRGFKLYVSMDLYAYGDHCYKAGLTTCNGPFDYYDVMAGYIGSDAWFKDTPNGYPMISTFSSGGFQWAEFNSWKKSWNNEIYFIPDFDETTGYYESSDAWWYYWGNITDGLFSWESAWPISSTRPGYGGLYAGDVSTDLPVIKAAAAHDQSYMLALSTLQYKNSYGANVYRGGELNMPKRMEGILNMDPQPDYVQIITWNDFPESHNIGNVWPEQNTDFQPLNYGNADNWPHQAWQGVHTSFIKTWKAGGTIADMRPVDSSNEVEGVMWYKTILQDAACVNDNLGDQYYIKPDNFDTGLDQLNYAIVLADGVSGLVARCYSDGTQIGPTTDRALIPGLNYGDCQGVVAGTQKLEILDSSGTVKYTAISVACVDTGCPQGIYNMNYQVVAVQSGDQDASCYDYAVGTFSGGEFVEEDYDPNANWRYVDCDAGSLTNIYNNGTQQWLDAKALEAWNDAVYSWKNEVPAGTTISFSNWVGNYFKTRPDMNCDQIDNANCYVTVNCGQQSSANADVNSPAGYLIINGFIGIHTGFDNFYDSLIEAQPTIVGRIGDFSSTFAPVFDQSHALKLALDILSLGWGLFSAPLFSSWLKTGSSFINSGDRLGVIQGVTNSLVTNSFILIKENTKVGLTALQQESRISDFLTQTVSAWISLLSVQLSTIFDGSDDSLTLLYSLIEDCQTFNTGNITSEAVLEPEVEKALWAYMVPIAWADSTASNIIAFIADSTDVPQDSGETDPCAGWDPSSLPTGDISISSSDGKQNFVCGAGTDNKPYWITSLQDTTEPGCDPVRSEDCGGVSFTTLPGISQLGSGSDAGNWGGLTRDDLVISALTSYKANGNANGWAAADPQNTDIVADIFNNGLNAVGLVNIPICGFVEAQTNVLNGKKTANYPCN